MIQEANIGVGLFGHEGSQAAMSADYAFGQFRFLTVSFNSPARMTLRPLHLLTTRPPLVQRLLLVRESAAPSSSMHPPELTPAHPSIPCAPADGHWSYVRVAE